MDSSSFMQMIKQVRNPEAARIIAAFLAFTVKDMGFDDRVLLWATAFNVTPERIHWAIADLKRVGVVSEVWIS